jgi:putative ABC transport system permease protein
VKLADTVAFSWTALSRHRRRSALSMVGVTVGVAAVLVLTALGEGARRYVMQEFASLGTSLVIVIPGRNETTGSFPGAGGVPNDLTLDDARAIRRELREAPYVVPLAMGNETVRYGERRRQVPIAGSTAAFKDVRQLEIGTGSFLPEIDMDRGAAVAVIGSKVARELFPSESPLGKIIRIGDWRIRVIGVLAPKGRQLGVNIDDMVIVPVATAMRMFDLTSLFRILIEGAAHSDLDGIKQRVIDVIVERHDEEDVTCLTQDAVVGSLSQILTVLTLAVGAIGGVSLAVAGLGVMNLMLVSVSERTEEVGLLKALGAGRRDVLVVFLTEAVLLATAGSLVGLALGWGLVRVFVAIYPGFPAAPPLWAVVSVIVVSVGVGALFGVLPARRATRLDPVAALAGR